MNRGKFISIEGPEGGGKSTQAKLLVTELEKRGHKVLLTREPGGTKLNEKIRLLLREELEDPPCDRTELLLFLAARAQIVRNVIRPALETGTWVVCDRFCDSTLAYQGYGRGLDVGELRKINEFATEGLLPDVTFLLDLTPEQSAARLSSRQKATDTKADRIELAGSEFHRRLREGFLQLAKDDSNRIRVIDANRPVDAVTSSMLDVLFAR